MPIYTIETDKGTFDIDANREPTLEEARAAIAQQQSPQDEETALRQQVIAESQKPLGQRLQERAMLPVNLVQGVLQDIFSLPSQLGTGSVALENEPTLSGKLGLLAQSGLEGASSMGTGINQMILGAVEKARRGELSPIGISPRDIFPQRLTEPEIARGVQQLQTQQAVEALKEEGRLAPAVFAEKASPELAKAGETLSLLAPIPGTQAGRVAAAGALRTTAKATAKAFTPATSEVAASRLIRTAIKPRKGFGSKIEKSTQESIGEIYQTNPNADKLGTMPIEGFKMSVDETFGRVGKEIGDDLSQQGIPVTTGDNIAAKINKEADQFERAGQSAEDIEYLRSRARDHAGKVDTIEATEYATTIANRKRSPLFKNNAATANAQRADVENVVNEIIAQEGGKVLNNALESLKGERGAQLRKTWSNLKTIKDNLDKRVDDLINKAPPEIQPTLVQAALSPEGIIGVTALMSGFPQGLAPLAAAAFRSWGKNSLKKLKDPNRQIERAYESLRRNPPSVMSPTPPARGTISMTLEGGSPVDEAIQRSLEVSGLPPATP